MCLAQTTKAEVLRELAVRSGNRARIDRLQTMVICLGERLGMSEDELWAWRSAVVAGEAGQVLEVEEIQELGFEEVWLTIVESRLFQLCCVVADAWNRGWEAEEENLADWTLDQVGALIDEPVREAFGYAVGVILPMRVD